MPRKFCCKAMRQAVNGWKKCTAHVHAHECPDALISIFGDEFGLLVHDGGNSHVAINYCPFCGEEAPAPELKMGRKDIIRSIEMSMPGVERRLLVEFNMPQLRAIMCALMSQALVQPWMRQEVSQRANVDPTQSFKGD